MPATFSVLEMQLSPFLFATFSKKYLQKTLIDEGAESLKKLAGRIDTEKMREPAFMMVLCGVAPFAYKREDGVYIVPVTCLKD